MKVIWAIARSLLIEIWRMRALMIFVGIVMAVYTIGFGTWVYVSEDRMDNKVQTFLSYSLSLMSVLGAFLVIFLSALTVSRDIKRKEIFTISTKPVSRHCYLLGKLAGMAVFYLMFVAINGALIYGIANYSRKVEVSADEAKVLKHIIFVARESVSPDTGSVEELAEAVKNKVDELVKKQVNEEPEKYSQSPNLENLLRAKILRQEIQHERNMRSSVPPGGSKVWHFKGIKSVDREDGGYLYVRFKQDVSIVPQDEKLNNIWFYGPKDLNTNAYEGQFFNDGRRETIRTYHEFQVPANMVSDNGDFYLRYMNNPQRNESTTVAFQSEREGRAGLEVLYAIGSFESNFARTLLLIFMRGLFLSIVGVALGAWLSFPVAVLSLLMVYLMGVSSEFITDAMRWEGGDLQTKISAVMMKVFPHLAAYDPVPLIERGLLVQGSMIVECALWLILIKGGLVALFGYVVFRLRELARVIV